MDKFPYNKREGVAAQRAEVMITKLARGYWCYPAGVDEQTFNTFIEDHAHMPPRGMWYRQQYTYILNLWKEHNMTPLQAAINERGTLIAERDKNTANIKEFEQTCDTLDERNAAITTEILALSATIGAEERKEREAKHKAMADELRAAGYKVVTPVTGTMKYPSFQQIPKGFAAGELIFVGAPISRGKTRFLEDLIAKHGDLQMYDTTTGKPAGTLSTALSGGGKAPGMNTPGTGAASAQPAPKLGGVHGVGEGWYKPLIYDAQGVKLEHDFAVNTRSHHEARNGWWLKHVPSGAITKGFPNEAEAYRWIKGRTDKRNFYEPSWSLVNWRPDQYHNTK